MEQKFSLGGVYTSCFFLSRLSALYIITQSNPLINLCRLQIKLTMSRSSRQILQHKYSNRDTNSLATLPHTHTPTLETRNFQELLQRAKRLYNNQQMLQAISVLLRGLYYDPLNPDLNYMLSVANLSLNRNLEAVKHLQQLKKTHPHYNNLMMLSAITYKKLGKLHEALNAINLHIQQQEDIQSLFFRSKINLDLKLPEKSIADLNRILMLQPRHSSAAILKIKCLQHMNCDEQALSAIKTAKALVQEADKLQEIYCQQAKIHIHSKDFQKAIATFEQIDKTFPYISQDTMLLRAKALMKAGKNQQSMMLYNDILAKNSIPRVFSEAVSQIAIACMRERDFYESFTYLKRTHLTKIRCSATDQLLKLTEGVTFLMKKKYAEGLLLMGSCELNFSHSLTDHLPFLRNLLSNSMAFAHFSLSNHAEALNLYLQLIPDQLSTDHIASSYNIHICQGILHHHQNNRELALTSFEKAAQTISRPQPYFYMAVILNEQYLKQPINTEGFVRILEIIEQGLKTGQSAHMYYYRSILYLFLGMNSEALQDIDRAIQRSQDNVAKYFYTRGIIFMLDRNYEQAVLQFTTALSIDDQDQDSILEKGKCQLLNGDDQNAFATIANARQHHQMKILFMLHQKQYAEILSQDDVGDNIKQICSFMEGHFQDAGPSGKLLLAILYQNYSQVIGLIEEAVGLGVPVGCLQTNDLLILKAFSQYRLNRDQQCLVTLSRVEGALKDTNKSSQTYSQQDQRKLLLCKVNVIMVNHRRGHQMEALGLVQELIGQVCEGPIFDELELLRQALVQGCQHQVDFALPTPLLSDYFASEEHLGVRYKFLIPLPNYHVPQVEHPPYQQLLLRFNLADIDNKPQAPWIRRGQYGVIFTNEVREFQNLNLKTQQNQAYRSRLPTSQQSRAIAQKKSELIQYLKLSASVLDKLDRLAKKGDPNSP